MNLIKLTQVSTVLENRNRQKLNIIISDRTQPAISLGPKSPKHPILPYAKRRTSPSPFRIYRTEF